MNKNGGLNGVIFAIVIIVIVASVTLIVGLERDAEQLIDFLSVAIVPTIAAFWAGSQASKAVKNTNGRMRQLIDLLERAGVDVPDELHPDD